MRLSKIAIKNSPPVTLFEVGGLADIVVIAGPNGVGKTRLFQRMIEYLSNPQGYPNDVAMVEATTEDEREKWGKATLDLSVSVEAGAYLATIQANRRRRNLKSSILQFESDRTIQNVQPYQFTFDITDPLEEELGWNFGFQTWKSRWQDTIHSMFRLIEHQKQSIANRAVQLRKEGRTEMKLEFDDPMTPFKDVFAQLLGPKELVDPSARQQTLEFKQNNQVFNLSALSSGEREVLNIAFDFLLRRPSDCVVFFDEPELHLHPELSYKLIQTLQRIGARNQFFLATHSPDVITASLDKSVVFVAPPRSNQDGPVNQAISVDENDETNQALKLLGHSIGIIALGKKIVLIEGEHSSVDKELYGSILRGRHPDLILVPSGGKRIVHTFSTLNDAVLSKTIWGVEFFMLCDGDSVPLGIAAELPATNRLRILDRYHVENFFLDEEVWATAFETLEQPEHWLRNPQLIRKRLRELAKGLLSYATALAVSAEVRRRFGNVDVMPKNCHDRNLDDLLALLQARVTEERDRAVSVISDAAIEPIARHFHNKLSQSLESDTDDWKKMVPGKPLVGKFAGSAGMNTDRMKKLYLSAAERHDRNPFAFIEQIFDDFEAAATNE